MQPYLQADLRTARQPGRPTTRRQEFDSLRTSCQRPDDALKRTEDDLQTIKVCSVLAVVIADAGRRAVDLC